MFWQIILLIFLICVAIALIVFVEYQVKIASDSYKSESGFKSPKGYWYDYDASYINSKDSDGHTQLTLALMRHESPEVIRCLVEHGANVNIRRANDTTPIMFAALDNPYPEVIDILVAAGADVNAEDYLGETPLHFAVRIHYNDFNPGIIKALVKAGADVNARSLVGDATVLMKAAERNANYTPEAVKTLIEVGADVSMKDSEGKTALDYAQTDEVRRIILEAVR